MIPVSRETCSFMNRSSSRLVVKSPSVKPKGYSGALPRVSNCPVRRAVWDLTSRTAILTASLAGAWRVAKVARWPPEQDDQVAETKDLLTGVVLVWKNPPGFPSRARAATRHSNVTLPPIVGVMGPGLAQKRYQLRCLNQDRGRFPRSGATRNRVGSNRFVRISVAAAT